MLRDTRLNEQQSYNTTEVLSVPPQQTDALQKARLRYGVVHRGRKGICGETD
jgi:hypothetical protein